MNNLATAGAFIVMTWRAAWRPPERRPIYEFAAEHIKFGAESPFPGKFRIINTPFIKEPCDQIRRDDIDKVSLSGVAQSAKSTFASLFAADCVANNPGSLTWNSPTKDAAKKTAEKKIWPIFRRCKPIQKILPKKGGFLTIKFPDAPLYVQTASEGNAHGDTVRYQVNDDLQIWGPGMLGKFEKRTEAFAEGKGRKIVNLMTGCLKTGEEQLPDGTMVERGDDAFEDWMKGTRSLWNVRCPYEDCRHQQPLVWRHRGEDGKPLNDFKGKPFYGIVWEDSECTRPGGRWNWDLVRRTAKWRCRKCERTVEDTRSNRRALNNPSKGAGYVNTNPFPAPRHWSGRYPAMASELISWGQLVTEFLSAKDCLAAGNTIPLREFVMNRLAEAWFAGETTETASKATADYALGDPWLDEDGKSRVALDNAGKARRYLLVDQQKDGELFKGLVREFAEGGASRLVAYYPEIKSREEVETLRIKHEVTPARVGFDVGDGNEVVENYQAIAFYGWTGLKGDGREGFEHITGQDNRRVVKPYSRRWYGDPEVGKGKTKQEKRAIHAAAQKRGGIRPTGLALCFHHSNPLVKDMLSRLRAGKGVYWGRPSNEPEEYTDGLNSEIKVQEMAKGSGRPYWRWKPIKKNNHPWDLECMALVMAMMSKILAAPVPAPTTGEEPAEK